MPARADGDEPGVRLAGHVEDRVRRKLIRVGSAPADSPRRSSVPTCGNAHTRWIVAPLPCASSMTLRTAASEPCDPSVPTTMGSMARAYA